MILAQTLPPTQHTTEIVFWLLIIAFAAVLIGVVGYLLRRRMLAAADDAADAIQPFTLADLRRLHHQGQLSDAEFERAKAHLIAKARAAMDRSAPDADAPPAAEFRDEPDRDSRAQDETGSDNNSDNDK